MTTIRGQCGAACLSDGRIIALGGTDDLNALRSVECYSDLEEKSAWRALSCMHHRRNKPSVAAVKDSVIVMGGWERLVAWRGISLSNTTSMQQSFSTPGVTASGQF